MSTVFFGYYAGAAIYSGCNNIGIGFQTGQQTCSGNDNIFLGCRAGTTNVSGSNNIVLGKVAGFYVTGSNNLIFGCDAGGAITTQSNRIVFGNAAHTCAQIQIGWTTVSDVRDKCIFGNVPHGRKFFEKINPIKFAFKDRITGLMKDPEGKQRYGFSAQEVLKAEGDNPVIVNAGNPELLMMTSDHMLPILVNAIKELSAEVDALIPLKELVNEMKFEIEELKRR